MAIDPSDPNLSLMLDGNAAAGILNEIFALEMTTNPVECASCGRESEIGALLAFMQAPGVILRCPTCENIILCIVQTPDVIHLDLRGTAYLRLKRSSTT
jgi:hypothetical protein